MKFFKSVHYFLARYLLQKKFLSARVDNYGLTFKFKTEDVVGRHIFKRGGRDKGKTQFLLNKIPLEDGDIIIDVGANIGWYSLIFDKVSSADIKVYAFEPDPLNFSLLKDNVKRNNCKNVVLCNQALSDKKATLKLYLYPNKNRGRHSILNINNCRDSVDVQAVPLENFLSVEKVDISRVKLIKIDVEGYEMFVFKGAGSLIGTVPYILCEFEPAYMLKGGLDPNELLDFMEARGYLPYTIVEEEAKLINFEELRERKSSIDIFWQKKQMPRF